MAWYRTGTVTVTQGSATIVGAGTDFVSNAVMGDGFRGPDGRTCEIARIVSATELTLAEGYAGPSAGGQPYAIQPTQSYLRDLAQSAATLLATFGTVRDGIGQGLIGDGSLAAPGIRFAADQDTGLARLAPNRLGLVAGGIVRFEISGSGEAVLPEGFLVSAGTAAKAPVGIIGRVAGANTWLVGSEALVSGAAAADDGLSLYSYGAAAIRAYTANAERMRIDAGGNLLIGATTPSRGAHTMFKAVAQGAAIFAVGASDAAPSIVVAAVTSYAPNGGGAAMYLGRHGDTGRSINASGTVNASGADYAEYMTKAADCGTIEAGDVCGVDIDGQLTRTWADALSFVVKSTDPAYVGGDTWASGLSPRPEMPGIEPVEPAAPPAKPDDEAELAGWVELVAAYPTTLAAWRADHDSWRAAMDAYERDLTVWEELLEAERVKVDRIAFCGQVPVNVTGEFAVGDYLIAAPAGAGIKAVAIAAADISFEQYRRRLGKVWAVRDGRAWVDVQHA